MIGFGILEFAMIWFGTIYVMNAYKKDMETEYIELSEMQFQSLKETLIHQDILPERMLLQNRIELSPEQIPPSYEQVRDMSYPPNSIPSSNSVTSPNSVPSQNSVPSPNSITSPNSVPSAPNTNIYPTLDEPSNINEEETESIFDTVM